MRKILLDDIEGGKINKMIYNEPIKGKYVLIRSAEILDARFTLDIRQDKEKTKYLHAVENNIDKQIDWLERQREAKGDYFFIVENFSGKELGTVGVYDIKGNIGHLGRLLMIGNPFQTFEAILLSMNFAYDVLGLEELYGDVLVGNSPSMNISEAVGFHFKEPVYEEELDRWVKYGTSYKNEFPEYRNRIETLIYRD